MISALAQILPLAHHNTVAALPVFAPALVVCIVITIWGAAQQRYGSASYNTSASERGKTLFSSGLVGCVLLGSIPALTAIAYGLGVG